MVRIYLDWNVISQMRNGLHSQLYELITQNRDKWLVFGSTAHVGDIYSSYKKAGIITPDIQADLEYLNELTRSMYFFQTPENEVVFEEWDAFELFEDRIESEKLTLNLFDSFNFDESRNQINLLKSFLNTTILPEEVMSTLSNSNEMIEIFPGLELNPTLGGLFDGYLSFYNQLNDSANYKGLRQNFQRGMGINRDKAFNWDEPFEKIEKILKNANLADSIIDYFEKNRPSKVKVQNWFDILMNLYLILDMSGFKEDSIAVEEKKKKTFRNTINDAFHAAFASQCDFYIINDKRSKFKTRALYIFQNINTEVIAPADTTNIELALANKKGKIYTINDLQELLTDSQVSISDLEDNSGKMITHLLKSFVYCFFNKIMFLHYTEKEESFFLLSREKPTNGRFTTNYEIKELIKRLLADFGNDLEDVGQYNFKEMDDIKANKWGGRKWISHTEARIEIKALNGYLQLYFYDVFKESDGVTE
jgi:hypothetical protein